MGINTLRPASQKQSATDAPRALREVLQHAIDRRVWYQDQMAGIVGVEMSGGDDGRASMRAH